MSAGSILRAVNGGDLFSISVRWRRSVQEPPLGRVGNEVAAVLPGRNNPKLPAWGIPGIICNFLTTVPGIPHNTMEEAFGRRYSLAGLSVNSSNVR